MSVQEQINKDNNWKEVAKKLVEKNDNYNEYEKEVLKFILDMYHESRKSMIIKNDQQAKLLESLLK